MGPSISDRAPDRTARMGWAIGGLLAFKLVINTVTRAIYPFLPSIARGMGISLTQAGALVSIRWGAALTTPLIIGTMGRRRSAATLMAAGGLAFAAGSLITAAIGVFGGAVVGFVLLGIGKPLFDIGSQTWISERVPFERRARALGIVEIAWAGGLLVGAPLFGWLIENHGWQAPFWVIGVVALVGSVVVATRRMGGDIDVDHPIATSRLDRPALALLVAAAAMSMSIELALIVLGEWLEVGFGLSLLALGAVGTLLGVAELVSEGGVLAFTDRIGSRRAMQLSAVSMTLGFVVFALTSEHLVAGLAAFTVTLMAFEFGIVSALPLATELRPHDRPRFLSIYLVTSSLGRIAADLTAPTVFARWGMGAVAVLGAVAAGITLLVVSRWVVQPGGPDRSTPPIVD